MQSFQNKFDKKYYSELKLQKGAKIAEKNKQSHAKFEYKEKTTNLLHKMNVLNTLMK